MNPIKGFLVTWYDGIFDVIIEGPDSKLPS